MSQKTVPIKHPTALKKPADDWIGQGSDVPNRAKEEIGPTKRLTVDIAEALHRRIKVQCAEKGVQIADVVRDLLAQEFPVTPR